MVTIWIAVGGGVGAAARYHVGLWAAARGAGFPWGTLAINLVGSFLLAVLAQAALAGRVSEPVQLALGVGVLGGFTTYSTFNLEVLELLRAGTHGRAVAYLAATVAGGLLVGLAGWGLAGWALRR
jgi:CrcB protein